MKKFIALFLAVILVFNINLSVLASSDYYFEKSLEVEKNVALTSIKEQLKMQGKENMYYLFENIIEHSYTEISNSRNSLNKVENATSSNTYYVPGINYSGAISFKDWRTQGVIQGLSAAETQNWYNKTTVRNPVEYVELAIFTVLGGLGVALSTLSIASNIVYSNSLYNILQNSKRAQIMSISDIIEGQATVIFDWGYSSLALTAPQGFSIYSWKSWIRI